MTDTMRRPGANGAANNRTELGGALSDSSVAHNSPSVNCGDGQRIPIHDFTGRVVGEAVAGEFRKDRIFGSRHMLRKPPAWCFCEESPRQAEAAGASAVELTDQETGKRYRATIALIGSKGFRVNRGHGEQLALELGWWSVDGRRPQKELAGEDSEEPSHQLLLWGGAA